MREMKLLESGERLSEDELDDSRREEEAYRWGAARYLAGLAPRKEHESFREYRAFMAEQGARRKVDESDA